MTHAAVVGARGYAGRELVRLLQNHPKVRRVAPISTSAQGDTLAAHVPSFTGSGLRFHGKETAANADVVFLATPHGTASQWINEDDERVVIDLSRDHRGLGLDQQGWTYGWADLQTAPAGAKRIANPGCYPTAAMLAIAPLLRTGLTADGPIIVDGKSGITGAGITPRPDLHFPEADGSVRAYKVDGHDHQREIEHAVQRLGGDHRVRFTPHLVPQSRGLLTTCYVPLASTDVGSVKAAYERAYADQPFVHVCDEAATGHVRGTNHAHVAVHVDPETRLAVVRAAIDNLLKGAAGTAMQNMNDVMGWHPTLGFSGAEAA